MKYPTATTGKLIIVANVVKKLMEDSFKLDSGPADTCRAALYLEKGVLHGIHEIAPKASLGEVFQKPKGWRLEQLPPEWILIPGFIDCHVHVALDGVSGFSNFTAPPPLGAVQKHLQQAAQAGIFALRDGGDLYNTGIVAAGLKKGLPGRTLLPMVVPTGQAISRKGYYGSKLGTGIAHLDELDSTLQQLADNGAKQVKLILSGLVSLKTPWKVGPRQFSQAELKTIVQRAGEYELPVMAHVNGDENVRLAIRAGVHTIEHGYYITKETLQLMAASGVAWVPTVAPLAAMLSSKNGHKHHEHTEAQKGTLEIPQAGWQASITGGEKEIEAQEIRYGEQTGTTFKKINVPAKKRARNQKTAVQQAVEHQLKMIYAAQELGVTLGLGTDAGAPGVGWGNGFRQEFNHYRRAGLSPLTILQIATVNNAHLLGLPHKMGKIARGKKPCWIFLHKDILGGEKSIGGIKGWISGEQFRI